MKTLSNESFKPSKLSEHLTKVHPNYKNKDINYFKNKADRLKEVRLDQGGSFQQQSMKYVEASYYIALQIAKNKKPHTIGEKLIKPCLLEAVRLILNEDSYKKIMQISLSNDTVRRRIHEMADDIKKQVIEKVNNSPFFSIQLDESTDVSQCSQLMVFVRYINGSCVEEEFLFCEPLPTTTTAIDVMEYTSNFFDNARFSWDKLVGVCTDGAPAMLGSRSGFISRIKQKNPNVTGTHCLIHREALASKTLPGKLSITLTNVINIVNYVKGGATTTRLFRALCQEYESAHQDLLFHTRVRWLSKGNMLSRVLELHDELVVFLEAQGKNNLLSLMKSPCFKSELAYLVDIFAALNSLNVKLQGRQSNIIIQCDVIKAFMAKVSLWRRKINTGNTFMFDKLSEILDEDSSNEDLKHEINEHLTTLENEFNRYFPEINTDSIEMSIIRNPFACQVDDVPQEIQENFLELTNDSFMKGEFQRLELSDFWVKILPVYPKISKIALRVLIPFSSTYLCESAFSSLMAIKTKSRNKLLSEADARCALSITTPRLSILASNKESQISH
jgi:hypothetical protein